MAEALCTCTWNEGHPIQCDRCRKLAVRLQLHRLVGLPIAPPASCANAWGGCMRHPLCADTACEGHPVLSCSTCKGGPCRTPEACELPIAELQPINRRLFTRRTRLQLPATREAWGRAIGAALGLAGTVFFAGAIARHLQILT